MLCVEVSARSSSAPKLNLIGQCTSGPTFWWTKPPVPVSSRPPADTASEVGVEPFDGHREGACIRGGPRRTGGGEDPAGPDPPGRRSHPAQIEEETGSGRGAERTRSAVRQGQRAAGRIGAVLGHRESTRSLEDPAHTGARLGDRDPGTPLSGATASSGAHLRSPRPPFPVPVCPQQTTAMPAIPVRQRAQTLQHVGEQSPSEPLPLPRTPAPGPDPDRAAMLGLQDPPHRAAKLELQDPPGGPPSVCSPGTNMAAHTLVILSRTIVSQAITPPRCRGHQGAPHSCGGRKSLQHELLPRPASRSQPQLSANRSRVKRRKRLRHCLPDDLDVDKFLSSLHYDE
ncbi:uncharacterized protein LOC133108701 [Conger conger]|uniref:uncharacterized protein LOC133108701 n=1 Tax=Conger conger TaxID=82655 RepID=UPI002A59EB66|nr:uncharacterized protein LOC133108701 [Conger conger]